MAAFGHSELPFVIPDGAPGLSAALDLNGLHAESIIMPAAWAAAGLSFAACETQGGTFLPLVDAMGQEITLTVAADQWVMLPVGMIRGIPWLKLQSGTAAAPVDQTADRTVTLIARKYL